MITRAANPRAHSALLTSVVFLFVLGLGALITVPNFVSNGPGKINAIINNLRQLDGAEQQWAEVHGYTNVTPVTPADIAPYVKDGWHGNPVVTVMSTKTPRVLVPMTGSVPTDLILIRTEVWNCVQRIQLANVEMEPSDSDRRVLRHAESLLELKQWREANEELKNISAQSKAHPDVLRVRRNVWEMAGQELGIDL